ncbi:hypothetical protein E3Q04_02769 [Wallemia mellicola]|nr:hypothetical protein E3Q04_02769 [Wallemia mellicola]
MERIRKALYDKRRGIGIAAAVATGTYFICQYLSSKLSEIQDQSERDRTARDTLRRKFYQTLQDCTFTVMALLPSVDNEIDRAFKVQTITEELKERAKSSTLSSSGVISEKSLAPSSDNDTGSAPAMQTGPLSTDSSALSFNDQSTTASSNGDSSPDLPKSPSKISELKLKSKKDLWEDLKVGTFSQSITIHYAVTLLSLLTHIQLSHLGREAYVAQLRALARSRAPVPFDSVDDNDTYDKTYLSLTWWFIYTGLPRLSQRVKAAVDEIIGPATLRDLVDGNSINVWIDQVRNAIEGGPIEELLEDLFPMTDKSLMVTLDNNHQLNTGELFIDLVQQTRDSLQTADFKKILSECLNKNFSSLSASISQLQEGKLASQLPKIKKLGQSSLQSVPNDLVENVSNCDDLLTLDALIQTNYETSIDKF